MWNESDMKDPGYDRALETQEWLFAHHILRHIEREVCFPYNEISEKSRKYYEESWSAWCDSHPLGSGASYLIPCYLAIFKCCSAFAAASNGVALKPVVRPGAVYILSS